MNKRPLLPRLTKTELAVIERPPAKVATHEVDDLLKDFLAGRNRNTLREYDRDLKDFAWFVQGGSASAGLAYLLSQPHVTANRLALRYKNSMVDRGLTSATVARRLAALRSFVTMARTVGAVAWTLDVRNPTREEPRDTKGPGTDGWKAMLDRVTQDTTRSSPRIRRKAIRDRAILRLLHDLGLRRGELVALDLADLDLDRGTIDVLGKGRTVKKTLTLPEPTQASLIAWLGERSDRSGPLFIPLSWGVASLDRLTVDGVYQIVGSIGKKAGIHKRVKPHGLRHESISRALDKMKGDVRTVQKFSRHSDIRTVLIYDDRGKDVAGDVAKLVAEDDVEPVAEDVVAEDDVELVAEDGAELVAKAPVPEIVAELMAEGWTPPARTPQ